MGTRPEIIKLAPIIKKLPKSSSTVIFTGQHYDYEMSLQFIKQLGIRNLDYKMKLTKLQNTTTDRATQIGEIIINLAKIFTKRNEKISDSNKKYKIICLMRINYFYRSTESSID